MLAWILNLGFAAGASGAGTLAGTVTTYSLLNGKVTTSSEVDATVTAQSELSATVTFDNG